MDILNIGIAVLGFISGVFPPLLYLYRKQMPLHKKEVKTILAEALLILSRTSSHPVTSSEIVNQIVKNDKLHLLKVPRVYIHGVVHSLICLLDTLGPLSLDRMNNIKVEGDVKKEAAASFIGILRSHILDKVKMIEGWTSSAEEDRMKWIRSFLKKVETRRKHEIGEFATPSRVINAVLGIIKTKNYEHPEKDLFLMQWNPRWEGGMWWFVGGIVEINVAKSEKVNIKDIDEEMKRELIEELDIKPAHIRDVKLISEEVYDRRVSYRMGALTKYKYYIYSISLDLEGDVLERLTKRESEYITINRQKRITRKNKWLSWEEIKKDPNLQLHAGDIIKQIEEKCPPDKQTLNPYKID